MKDSQRECKACGNQNCPNTGTLIYITCSCMLPVYSLPDMQLCYFLEPWPCNLGRTYICFDCCPIYSLWINTTKVKPHRDLKSELPVLLRRITALLPRADPPLSPTHTLLTLEVVKAPCSYFAWFILVTIRRLTDHCFAAKRRTPPCVSWKIYKRNSLILPGLFRLYVD